MVGKVGLVPWLDCCGKQERRECDGGGGGVELVKVVVKMVVKVVVKVVLKR